jgi:hypothetical protein
MAASNGSALPTTVASSFGLDPERCLRGKVADDAAGTGKRTRMSGRSSERAGWPQNVKETDRKRRRKFAGFTSQIEAPGLCRCRSLLAQQ